MVSDEQVGREVRKARGARPQESVSISMRVAGHASWRQTVVAKVESGERSLRLNEAVDLATILGCSVETLSGTEDTSRAAMELRMLAAVIQSRLEDLLSE